MSFALDYRKKLQAQEQREQAFRKANEGFVTLPLSPDADTRGNGRRVLMALVIAGGLVAVLNSGGLVNYSYGLADSRVGRTLVVASEHWHQLMERGKATRVVDHIRGSVAMIRETSWHDLKVVLVPGSGATADTIPHQPHVIPASTPPQPGAEPDTRESVKPDESKPSGPVMRAAMESVR